MAKSTTIIAFDQHAATTVAAVLLPGQQKPAVHHLTSDIPTLLRFVQRVRRAGPVQCCYDAATACSPGAANPNNSSSPPSPASSPASSGPR